MSGGREPVGDISSKGSIVEKRRKDIRRRAHIELTRNPFGIGFAAFFAEAGLDVAFLDQRAIARCLKHGQLLPGYFCILLDRTVSFLVFVRDGAPRHAQHLRHFGVDGNCARARGRT